MSDELRNQMMYLASWELLKKLAREKVVDIEVINNINRKNAEMLMCDLLPIGKIDLLPIDKIA